MPETSFFISWSASQPCVENAVPEPRRVAVLAMLLLAEIQGVPPKYSSLYYVVKCKYTRFLIVM